VDGRLSPAVPAHPFVGLRPQEAVSHRDILDRWGEQDGKDGSSEIVLWNVDPRGCNLEEVKHVQDKCDVDDQGVHERVRGVGALRH